LLRSVGGKLESSSVERFGMNAAGGRRGFEGVLGALAKQMEARGEYVPETGNGWANRS
jgi:hypothetical protein